MATSLKFRYLFNTQDDMHKHRRHAKYVIKCLHWLNESLNLSLRAKFVFQFSIIVLVEAPLHMWKIC